MLERVDRGTLRSWTKGLDAAYRRRDPVLVVAVGGTDAVHA
jgi:hypothetical protein